MVALGAFAWVLALTQGWLGGPPGTGRHAGQEERRSPGGRFDPRDVPIVVDVYEYGFTPSNVVIKAGHAVAWRDVGKEHHIIEPRSIDGRRVFIVARAQGSAAHVFRRPGVYPYHCRIHPWMRGRVTVRQEL